MKKGWEFLLYIDTTSVAQAQPTSAQILASVKRITILQNKIQVLLSVLVLVLSYACVKKS